MTMKAACRTNAPLLAVSILTAVAVLPASTARAQAADFPPDSAANLVRTRSPRGALLRSIAVPGWGQLYNGQVLKAPIFLAAVGGLAVTAAVIDRDYRLYRRAFQYKDYQERVDRGQLAENPRADYQADYDKLAAELGPVSASPLRSHRDALRRNRDLAFLGIGLVWAFAALDAYVNAHLLEFDVGENLSLRIAPGPVPGSGVPVAPSLVWHPGR